MKTSSQVPTLKNGPTETSSNTDKASLLNEVCLSQDVKLGLWEYIANAWPPLFFSLS